MILNPTIILALLFLAGTTLMVARRIQQRVGIPWSHDIRADADGALPHVPLLVDDELQLVGKPDYIVRRGADLIPVEVKPLRRAKRPYESDIYQLLAYCLLIERTYGNRPPYGLLRYATQTFRIDYDDDMAASVIDIVMQMHHLHDTQDVPRNHNSVMRCRGCGFWQKCDQSLVLQEE
ncbi:MAG: CRISPR-associated protein Cas4 [Roseiflexaceae bacterium]